MQPRHLVVIGASAGGIEALCTLAAGIPRDFPAAVAIVLHTSPQSPGILHEILNRCGPLQALSPKGRERIRPGTIYVAPPDHHVLLAKDTVHVTQGPWASREVRLGWHVAEGDNASAARPVEVHATLDLAASLYVPRDRHIAEGPSTTGMVGLSPGPGQAHLTAGQWASEIVKEDAHISEGEQATALDPAFLVHLTEGEWASFGVSEHWHVAEGDSASSLVPWIDRHLTRGLMESTNAPLVLHVVQGDNASGITDPMVRHITMGKWASEIAEMDWHVAEGDSASAAVDFSPGPPPPPGPWERHLTGGIYTSANVPYPWHQAEGEGASGGRHRLIDVAGAIRDAIDTSRPFMQTTAPHTI